MARGDGAARRPQRPSGRARGVSGNAWVFLGCSAVGHLASRWRCGSLAAQLCAARTANTLSTTPSHRRWCSTPRPLLSWLRLPRPVAFAHCRVSNFWRTHRGDLQCRPRHHQRAARHDSLHQRHDQPAQGRGHHPCQHCGANHDPGGGMGVVGRRSHPALSAAAPCSRNHQCGFLRSVVGRDLRDAAALRCECRVGAHRQWPADTVHGGANGLREAYRRLGCGFVGAPCAVEPGMREVAPDGVRLGGVTGKHAGTLEGNQWPHLAGALWHDRDWHGAVESVARRARPGQRRDAASRASKFGLSERTATPVASGIARARSKSVVQACLRNTGASPRRPAMPSEMAGFALAILQSWRTASIAFLAARALTSSRLADTKFPRWRLRKRCANIPRSPNVRSSAWLTRSGASESPRLWC